MFSAKMEPHRWVTGLFAHQRYHFSGEALQARDALGDGFTAEVKDQFVHADSGEGTDVAGDFVRLPEKLRRMPSRSGMAVSYSGAL